MMMKISMMGRSLTTLSLALAASTLGGCGRSEPAPDELQGNEVLESPLTGENMAVLPPPPVEIPTNVTEPPPPAAAKVDPDEETQMHEDADAVGLTSRMNQNEEVPVAGGNQTGAEQ